MLSIRFILSIVACLVGGVLMLPALIIISPFWFIFIISKIVNKLKPTISEWEDIIEFDPDLGWRAKPSINTHMDVDGVYHMTTGRDGWRGNYDLKKSNVVVIGDSFVFGQGSDDKDYFANLTNLAKTKPIGAPGYGAVHYLLLLRRLNDQIRGKIIVWFIYTGNDLRESIRPSSYGYHFPFVFRDSEKADWKIKTDHINSKKLPFNFEKSYKTSMPELADLFSQNYFSDYAYGALEYLLKEAKKYCDGYGAKFVVVPLPIHWLFDGNYNYKIKRFASKPDSFSVKYPEDRVKSICKNNGINFKPSFDYFTREDFLPNDLHWSKSGNKKAAIIIEEIFASLSKKS
jgi:hypothetical protein